MTVELNTKSNTVQVLKSLYLAIKKIGKNNI